MLPHYAAQLRGLSLPARPDAREVHAPERGEMRSEERRGGLSGRRAVVLYASEVHLPELRALRQLLHLC